MTTELANISKVTGEGTGEGSERSEHEHTGISSGIFNEGVKLDHLSN